MKYVYYNVIKKTIFGGLIRPLVCKDYPIFVAVHRVFRETLDQYYKICRSESRQISLKTKVVNWGQKYS